jgi:hypothetical protein
VIKEEGYETQVYKETAKAIHSEVFADISSESELYKTIEKEFYGPIYEDDWIFGHRVELFADLSQEENLTEKEVQEVVNEAIDAVERDFADPPDFAKEPIDNSLSFGGILFLRYCSLAWGV